MRFLPMPHIYRLGIAVLFEEFGVGLLHLEWHELRCLVTGGAGFIGSHLVDELLRIGARVRVVDDLSRGKKDNIAHCLDRIEFMRGDLAEQAIMSEILRDIDVCFHLAAVVGGVEFMNSHPAEISKNVLIDRNVIDGCRRMSTERLLYTSTACTYPTMLQEEASSPALKEEDAFSHGVNPDSYYGWTKVMGEVVCRAYHDAYGMDISIVRPFNPYGPREYFDPDSSHVIPALIRRAVLRERPFVVWGDGEQSRAFQYVTDVARAFALVAERSASIEPVNLGTSQAIKIRDLARLVLDLAGYETQIQFDTTKPRGVACRRADTTRATNQLGWKPEVALEHGLRTTVEWFTRKYGQNP